MILKYFRITYNLTQGIFKGLCHYMTIARLFYVQADVCFLHVNFLMYNIKRLRESVLYLLLDVYTFHCSPNLYHLKNTETDRYVEFP